MAGVQGGKGKPADPVAAGISQVVEQSLDETQNTAILSRGMLSPDWDTSSPLKYLDGDQTLEGSLVG